MTRCRRTRRGDLFPGEWPDDRYSFSFRLDDPPRIGTHAPSGAVPGPVDRLRIDFSKPMAPGSFAIADDIAYNAMLIGAADAHIELPLATIDQAAEAIHAELVRLTPR